MASPTPSRIPQKGTEMAQRETALKAFLAVQGFEIE